MAKGNGCERKRQLLEGLNETTRHSENLDLEVENQQGSYKVTKQKFNIPLVI
jgi:hypothetical protein